MTKSKCYRTLGVSPRASIEEIKQRYRQLALQYHPDRTGGRPRATARFREIAEAYQILCQSLGKTPQGGPKAGREPRPQDFFHQRAPFNPDSWLRDFFGTETGLPRGPQQVGATFRYDLQISLTTAARGLVQEIAFPRLQSCHHCQATGMQPGTGLSPCPDCQGQGRLFKNPGQLRLGPVCQSCQGRGQRPTHPCTHCHGTGMLELLRRFQIRIPPGVENGTRILIPGEGGEGFRSGPAGNLVVVIHIEPSAFFTRILNDLYCRVEVSFAQAARGGHIDVPTLTGSKPLHLPKETRSGQIFRWPGLGMPGVNSLPPGDQIIEIIIAAPHEDSWKHDDFQGGPDQARPQTG